MAAYVVLVLALISCAHAAPWRCIQTPDAGVCYENWGPPVFEPHSVNINRPAPPCVGQVTVFPPCPYAPVPPPCPCGVY